MAQSPDRASPLWHGLPTVPSARTDRSPCLPSPFDILASPQTEPPVSKHTLLRIALTNAKLPQESSLSLVTLLPFIPSPGFGTVFLQGGLLILAGPVPILKDETKAKIVRLAEAHERENFGGVLGPRARQKQRSEQQPTLFK